MAATSSPDPVLYEKSDHLAWLTLNRPHVLNAQNMEVRDALWTYLHAFNDDPDALVVIIRGNGPSFSSGADVSEFGTAPSYLESRRARRERDVWGYFLHIDKPIIAAIHGYALGAGLEMALLCDIRIASEDARFGLPEVNLGYIPSAGGSQTLPRAIPPGVAMGLILSADLIDAPEALRLGLVNRIVPRDRLYAEAEALARGLIARPQRALRYAKQAIVRGADLPLAAAIALERRLARRLP